MIKHTYPSSIRPSIQAEPPKGQGDQNGSLFARILRRAMQQPDDLVVSMEYLDSKGQRTRRVVSPIRFVGKGRFLGLCLGRCEPRQFQLDRCDNLKIQSAVNYVMPVPIEEVASSELAAC